MYLRSQQLGHFFLRVSVLPHLLSPIHNNYQIGVGEQNIRLNLLTIDYSHLVEGVLEALITRLLIAVCLGSYRGGLWHIGESDQCSHLHLVTLVLEIPRLLTMPAQRPTLTASDSPTWWREERLRIEGRDSTGSDSWSWGYCPLSP